MPVDMFPPSPTRRLVLGVVAALLLGACATSYGPGGLAAGSSVDEAVRRMVLDGADGDGLRRHAMDSGMMTLRQAGFRRALQGLTTMEEVMAVVADQE